MHLRTPAGAGLVLIAALAGCGGGSSQVTSTPLPPSEPPTAIDALIPDQAMSGGAPFTLVVQGFNFTRSSKVLWDRHEVSTTFVSSSELKAAISTADLKPQGGVAVSVRTPGTKDAPDFNFGLTNPPWPKIQSLGPAGVDDGSGPFTLKVLGKGFIPASQVTWNGTVLSTTYVSSHELDAAIPGEDVAKVASAEISVKDAVDSYYLANIKVFMIGYTVTVLDLHANDLAWDPVRQLLYISLQDDGTISHNSSIATYDPATGVLGTLAVTTPFETDRLAISDDDSYLYAGVDGNSQVLRYALPGAALDQTINLPPTSSGRAYPLDIEVQPGAPHTFATIIAASGLSVTDPIGGIQIYDDATPRANPLPYYSVHHLYDSTSIQWSMDGTRLYGADGLDTDFSFFIMHVDATGITSTDIYDNVFPDFYPNIRLDPATGYLFSSFWQVVDPSVPSLVYNSECIGYYGLPDDTTGRAYYLTSSQGHIDILGYAVLTCDKATGKLISEIELPQAEIFPHGFIRFGADGLAFTSDGGKVILVRGHVVAP